MAAKEVKFSVEARDKMLHGVDILAKCSLYNFTDQGIRTIKEWYRISPADYAMKRSLGRY